jgi:hypothetical protein
MLFLEKIRAFFYIEMGIVTNTHEPRLHALLASCDAHVAE